MSVRMTEDELEEIRGESDEESIHKQVVEWAGAQSGTWPELDMLLHVPNGGDRHPATGKKLKEMGARQGVPDLQLPVRQPGYHGLWLELKSPQGRLRPKQAWWLRDLKREGFAVGVAWTFSEARSLLLDYLKGEHEPQTVDLTIAEPPRHAAEA